MKNQYFMLFFAYCLMFTLCGCAVVGGIFKAGVWVGVLLVVLVVALIVYFFNRSGNNRP